LHIQKFIEDESQDTGHPGGLPKEGNWRPVSESNGNEARMYIQKGSKMNDGDFDSDNPF
jgi:hypothetical protein